MIMNFVNIIVGNVKKITHRSKQEFHYLIG